MSNGWQLELELGWYSLSTSVIVMQISNDLCVCVSFSLKFIFQKNVSGQKDTLIERIENDKNY